MNLYFPFIWNRCNILLYIIKFSLIARPCEVKYNINDFSLDDSKNKGNTLRAINLSKFLINNMDNCFIFIDDQLYKKKTSDFSVTTYILKK